MNRDHRDLHVLTHSFPTLRSSDLEIREQIKRVHEASFGLYGARKVWHQMRREGIMVAKCTVERLMRAMGLAGVRRGKKTITTISNPKAPCPLDKVNRAFRVSRLEEHTSELQSLMRISYAVFCLKKKKKQTNNT